MKRVLFIFIAIVLCPIVSYGWQGAEFFLPPLAAEVESHNRQSDEVQQELLAFSLTGYGEGGKKVWEIAGESADIMAGIVKLKNVVVKAYEGENTITLTADEGEIHQESKDVRLERNVVATTSDGIRLTTDYLEWQAEDEIVTTDRKVWVKRKNIESFGKGAVAHPNLKKVKLMEDVTIKVKDEELITKSSPQERQIPQVTIITCDGPLEIDYENNIAVFNENVEVNDPRGKIFGEKIEVHFDPTSETINWVIAAGDVRIFRGENVTYSEKAVYNASLGKVTLTGRPRLVIYSENKNQKPETSNQKNR